MVSVAPGCGQSPSIVAASGPIAAKMSVSQASRYAYIGREIRRPKVPSYDERDPH